MSARVLVVNPNTSSAMTETIRAAAESAAWAMDIEVTVLAPQQGPQSVEGRFDEVVSAYWTVDAVLQAEQVFDGVAVACYGPHPAVEALREALAVPVMGVMEASVLYALPLCGSFSIVTTSPRWEPILRESIRDLGIEHRCASVRSSGLAVLDLDRLPPDEVRARLAAEARAAVEQEGAELIILGCAGMAGLQQAVGAAAGVPVVDPVVAAVALLASLARTGARTSKRNLYRPVDPRLHIEAPPGIRRAYEH